MKVLVTGHLGYIGMVLVPFLLERGHDVVGLDADLFNACSLRRNLSLVLNIKKDIRDVEITDLYGFDAVIHLAGLSNDPLCDLDPDLTDEINYRASTHLASLSKQGGVKKFIFSSSCSVYGRTEDGVVNEESRISPLDPYSLSKSLAEKRISEYADRDFAPVFLRNATVYGMSPKIRFDLVLNNLMAWAMTTGKIYLKSDGSAWRPLVHVEDVSRAFIAVLESPPDLVSNQIFNIGRTEENFKITTLAETVNRTVPNSKIEFSHGAAADPRSYNVSFERFRETFGNFRFRWDTTKGADQLYQGYRKLRLRLEDFEGVRFKRIDHIKFLLAEGRLDSMLRWKNGG